MKDTWYIRGGRLIDPLTGRDEAGDLYVENGVIAPLPARPPDWSGAGGTARPSCDVPEVDARGLVVVPGFVDLHVHFREPGNEEDETIESGSRAAARGGFTTVVTMPNTDPPIDPPERVTQILACCGKSDVRIMIAGCISRGRLGKELADLPEMSRAGAIAFTDDGSTSTDEGMMARAMDIAKKLDTPILDHALDPSLAGKGVMHEGAISARFGMPGIPARAEAKIVERDLRLSEQTGCAIHIQHVSTTECVNIIRSGLERGLRISGEVTPHHLALTDSDVSPDNTNFKMNPPLRTSEDRQALRSAVADGTLQAFATDHAPHCRAKKEKGFIRSPFGVVGLETAVGITYSLMVKSGLMNIMEWVHRWTIGPARVLGMEPPGLSIGLSANFSILDLDSEWIIRSDDFFSKSRNTPFEGHKVTGRAICTFCRGVMTWDGRARGNDAVDTCGRL